MILTDSSVWIDHLRASDSLLLTCLEVEEIAVHPFVIGELALGSMPKYDEVLEALEKLPKVEVATDAEVIALIRGQKLMGTGIGYVDAHLLASVRLTGDTLLWTRDRKLRRIAEAMHLAAKLD